MKEFVSDHKIHILAVLAIAALIGFGVYKFTGKSSPAGETTYVETVENLTGQNASLGLINRFAGIVEMTIQPRRKRSRSLRRKKETPRLPSRPIIRSRSRNRD